MQNQFDLGAWLSGCVTPRQKARQTHQAPPQAPIQAGPHLTPDARKIAALVALIGEAAARDVLAGYQTTKQKSELPAWLADGSYAMKEWQ